jgi:hypothetical protein
MWMGDGPNERKIRWSANHREWICQPRHLDLPVNFELIWAGCLKVEDIEFRCHGLDTPFCPYLCRRRVPIAEDITRSQTPTPRLGTRLPAEQNQMTDNWLWNQQAASSRWLGFHPIEGCLERAFAGRLT